eukprot:GHUV01023421.1.p1 GENE.GHUV01023421.1~~GHUV01023421.1.p1  ORF type:complete len:112 (-),score=5.24 GHUV01023421.1:259-594(-)
MKGRKVCNHYTYIHNIYFSQFFVLETTVYKQLEMCATQSKMISGISHAGHFLVLQVSHTSGPHLVALMGYTESTLSVNLFIIVDRYRQASSLLSDNKWEIKRHGDVPQATD